MTTYIMGHGFGDKTHAVEEPGQTPFGPRLHGVTPCGRIVTVGTTRWDLIPVTMRCKVCDKQVAKARASAGGAR